MVPKDTRRRHTVLDATYRGAILDPSGKYRLWLWRSLTQNVQSACAWVLNNPSIADGQTDDPTVRRAWAFTRDWGYDSMVFVNTNPYRSTNPSAAGEPPEYIQAINDKWLREVMMSCQMVVCGWGDKANPKLTGRAVRIMHEIGPLHALRITMSGNPQHPLYLPGNLTPTLWSPEKWLH